MSERNERNVLFWGLGLGLLAGLFIAGWVFGRGFPAVPFSLRFAQVEKSSQFDLRLMLNETQQKLEDLSQQNKQLRLEIQDLREKVLAVEGMFSPVPLQRQTLPAALQEKTLPFTAAYSPQETGSRLKVLECRQEIFRLCKDGVSRQEIARQLELGQGEVELVLSLQGHRE